MVTYIRNREDLENRIVAMRAEGWPIRGLARHFKISKNTVRKILRKNQDQRDNGHEALKIKKTRPSKLDPFIPSIKRILDEYPDITGVRLLEELRVEGFDGGKSILNEYLRKVRPKPKREPVVRFETEPGEQAQMDWSEHTVKFRKTGKAKVISFSYLLAFSRRQYIDFTPDKKFHTLIRRHQDAFSYFDGVCERCLYDNEKTVVLRWEAGQPVYNPAFTAFCTHHQTRPVACRPKRPETKGKVERVFGYLNTNFFNGRTFDDFEDLRQCVKWWLSNRSDTHTHETTGFMPIQLFLEKEKAALVSLPRHPYDTSEICLRVCRIDGYIEHETNLYSVPYEYVADILTLKAMEHEILVYDPNLKLIARHGREPYGAGKIVEETDHLKSRRMRYGLEPVEGAFLKIGPFAQAFLAGLKNQHNPGYQARHILSLKAKYHTEDINKALGRAVKYYAFEAKAIERILMAHADPRPLEFIRQEKIDEIMSGLPTIKQRSLTEYGDLL